MKILFVCQYYFPENFSTHTIAKTLASFGHEVTVLTGRPNYGFGHVLREYRNVKFEIIDGVKIHRVWLLARKNSKFSIVANYMSFYLSARLWIASCHEKFDVVYSMSLSPVISVVPALDYAKHHKVKSLLHVVDLWPESVAATNNINRNSKIFSLLKEWSRRIYSKADQIIVGSPSYKQYLEEVHCLKNKDLQTVMLPPITNQNEQAPILYGPGFHIVYAGNLGKIQLLEELIEAATKLKGKNVFFHIIGFGVEKDHFIEQRNAKDLHDVIIYHGGMPSSQAVSYFPDADALYVPLLDQGYVGKTIPNKLIMYLAFGRPILGAIKGDARNLLLEAKGAVLTEPTSSGIYQGVMKLLNQEVETLSEMGKSNRKYFEKHLSNEQIGHQIENYLIALSK